MPPVHCSSSQSPGVLNNAPYSTSVTSDNLFLAGGEYLASSESVEEFDSQIEESWLSARRSIVGVSLYGKPFMPSEEVLGRILADGRISLRMVLVDPDSEAAREIAVDKCRFSRTVQQSDVLTKTLRLDPITPEILLQRIRDEVTGTVDMLRRTKAAHPKADVAVRYIDFLPVWKGTIIDGSSAVYVIYDVPRVDVPFRYSGDLRLISYYQKRYADVYYRQGREIPL